jgi:type II secretory pathway component PulC
LHPSLAKTSSPLEISTPEVIVQSVKHKVADNQQEIINVQQASPVDLTEMEIVPPEADFGM